MLPGSVYRVPGLDRKTGLGYNTQMEVSPMKKAIYTVTIFVLLVVFGVSAFMVGRYIINGRQQAQNYEELAQMREEIRQENEATMAATQPTEADVPTEPTEPRMLAEYAAVYEQNPDLVGWIQIDGTDLDYPVMHTPDRVDYYLKRDFFGQQSDWGCIYIREQCDMFEPSDNITVYGHTMRDGSMFACLHDYLDKETWEYNPLIFFDTLYEYHCYKIFAVFTTTASVGEGFTYHQMVDAESEADFNEFIATCKDLAVYDTGITPVYGDKVICLSTCEYTQENGRLVVAAVRIS